MTKLCGFFLYQHNISYVNTFRNFLYKKENIKNYVKTKILYIGKVRERWSDRQIEKETQRKQEREREREREERDSECIVLVVQNEANIW